MHNICVCIYIYMYQQYLIDLINLPDHISLTLNILLY